MKLTKRILAILLAVVLSLGVVSCGEGTNWIVKNEETTVPAGVYLAYLMNAYSEAVSQLEDSKADVFKTQIEGKDASTWIKETALQYVKRYVVVENLFSEMKLELTKEQVSYAQSYAQYIWSYYSEMYEQNGISYDSFYLTYLNGEKATAIFEAIYGEGGEKEVSKEDIEKYIAENVLRFKYISFDATDKDGNALKEGDELNAIKATADGYYERLKNGEGIDALADEYNASLTTSSQTTTSSEETTSSKEATSSEEVTSEEATSSEETSSEEDEEADRNVAVVDINNTSLTKETINTISALAAGEQVMVKDTYQYLIVEGLNVLEDEKTIEDYTSTARSELKGEEFEEYISTLAKDVEVELNQEAYDRYNPKKIKLQ